MPAPVYLVRHGQSEWNLLRLTQGQISHPALTGLGREQAASAAAMIAADLAGRGRASVEVVSSDLVRASQTAEIIAARLRAPVRYDARLREQHLGELEGRTYEETWAAAEQLDWSDPGVPVGGGESLMDVYDRMAGVLDELDELDTAGATVLVSHGDAIRTALAHLDGVKPHESAWVDVPNGAVARLEDALVWLG